MAFRQSSSSMCDTVMSPVTHWRLSFQHEYQGNKIELVTATTATSFSTITLIGSDLLSLKLLKRR